MSFSPPLNFTCHPYPPQPYPFPPSPCRGQSTTPHPPPWPTLLLPVSSIASALPLAAMAKLQRWPSALLVHATVLRLARSLPPSPPRSCCSGGGRSGGHARRGTLFLHRAHAFSWPDPTAFRTPPRRRRPKNCACHRPRSPRHRRPESQARCRLRPPLVTVVP
jgi:hypothetical protein